jgi:hypothetical protein
MIAIEAATTVLVVARPRRRLPRRGQPVVAGDDADEEGEEERLADPADRSSILSARRMWLMK